VDLPDGEITYRGAMVLADAMSPDRIPRQPFDASGAAGETRRVHSPIRSPPGFPACPESMRRAVSRLQMMAALPAEGGPSRATSLRGRLDTE